MQFTICISEPDYTFILVTVMQKLKLLKIDNVMFRVKDLKRSEKFYKNLGLKKAWHDKKNGQTGFVFPKSASEIVIHTDKNIPNPSFSFLVKDVEKFCEAHEKRGFRIFREPFDVRCGKFAVLKDLDGNELPIVDLTKFGGKPRYG